MFPSSLFQNSSQVKLAQVKYDPQLLPSSWLYIASNNVQKCMLPGVGVTIEDTGGNFHLKVGGGGKSSGNAGDPMLRVAVIP